MSAQTTKSKSVLSANQVEETRNTAAVWTCKDCFFLFLSSGLDASNVDVYYVMDEKRNAVTSKPRG